MDAPRLIALDLPDEVEDAMAAFGTSARVAIINLLRTDEPASKAHISATLGIEPKTTSYHLGKLTELGIIESDPPPGP